MYTGAIARAAPVDQAKKNKEMKYEKLENERAHQQEQTNAIAVAYPIDDFLPNISLRK